MNEPKINNPATLISHGLSFKCIEALTFAADAHAGQTRKGKDIAYISHPIAVSAMIMEYGGSEEQAIVGLLHDVIEDCDQKYADAMLDVFGGNITAMVYKMSDCVMVAGEEKPPWKERKERYIERLKNASPDILLVVACDKLHNVRSLIADLNNDGIETLNRFNATPDQIMWYYDAVKNIVNFTAAGSDLTIAVSDLADIISFQTYQQQQTAGTVTFGTGPGESISGPIQWR